MVGYLKNNVSISHKKNIKLQTYQNFIKFKHCSFKIILEKQFQILFNVKLSKNHNIDNVTFQIYFNIFLSRAKECIKCHIEIFPVLKNWIPPKYSSSRSLVFVRNFSCELVELTSSSHPFVSTQNFLFILFLIKKFLFFSFFGHK
jgi:hypothetical protein